MKCRYFSYCDEYEYEDCKDTVENESQITRLHLIGLQAIKIRKIAMQISVSVQGSHRTWMWGWVWV